MAVIRVQGNNLVSWNLPLNSSSSHLTVYNLHLGRVMVTPLEGAVRGICTLMDLWELACSHCWVRESNSLEKCSHKARAPFPHSESSEQSFWNILDLQFPLYEERI